MIHRLLPHDFGWIMLVMPSLLNILLLNILLLLLLLLLYLLL